MITTGIDHLVFATPNLAQGVDEIEALTGLRASGGGQHSAWGTHNRLLSLGRDTYLEIIAPDPSQPHPTEPRPFGIDDLTESRLVTWAARGSRLEHFAQAAAERGVCLGEVFSGRRIRADGVVLSWQLTSPWLLPEGGLIPFFIDWGTSPHPAGSAAPGLSLVDLRAEHPRPQVLERSLRTLGLGLPVQQAVNAALVATINGPHGRIELR